VKQYKFIHWHPVDVASLCWDVPNLMLFCPLLLTGLDKGECSEADLQKAKGMVPKSLESYVVRKYMQNFLNSIDTVQHVTCIFNWQVTVCVHAYICAGGCMCKVWFLLY
jgi:hypothetical protein